MARISPIVSLAKIGINSVKGAPRSIPRALDAIPSSKAEFAQTGKKVGQSIKNAPKKAVTSAVIDRKGPDGQPLETIGNLWTGKKINPLHVGVAGGAYIAGNSMINGAQMNYQKPLELATMNNYQQQGAAEIMNYDGVAQQRAPQNLNANGSIVFGLHNGRKG